MTTLSGDNPDTPADHLPSIDRRDILIMFVMVFVYLVVALHNLGSFHVPQNAWQPLKAGESVDLRFEKPIDIARIYYFSGINENRYADAKFFILQRQGDQFRLLTTIEKKDCGVWKHLEVQAHTDQLKIIASPPGGALNEIAIIEKGSRRPYQGIKVTSTASSSTGPHPLLDEQQTFRYTPTFMHGFYFDEIYHARTAFEHLHGLEPYETTHPPLGKLFIATGIALLGMNGFGWRIVGTLFGAAMLPLMYLFAKKLFTDRFPAFCAAFLVMVDFMHFTHTRIAVIDIYATFFIMLIFYFIHDLTMLDEAEPPRQVLRYYLPCGVCLGLGAASKWISLYAVAGMVVILMLHAWRQYRLSGLSSPDYFQKWLMPVAAYAVFSFMIIPAAIYLLSYLPIVLIKGHGWIDAFRSQRDMWAYHSQLKATHPFSSPWWSWPLNLRPVWMYSGEGLPTGITASIASFGNPAVWWTGVPAVIAALILAIRRRDHHMTTVFSGLACQYLPWAAVPRLAFIYHFLSVMPFVVLSQVYVIQAAIKRWPGMRFVIYLYLVLAAALFIAFYPILSGLPVPESYVARLRWLKQWTF